MNTRKIIPIILLLIPVLVPPTLQLYYGISATLTLSAIILAYLPIWYYYYRNSDLGIE